MSNIIYYSNVIFFRFILKYKQYNYYDENYKRKSKVEMEAKKIFSVTKYTLKVCNTKLFSFIFLSFLVYFKIKNRKQVHLLKIKINFHQNNTTRLWLFFIRKLKT